MLTKLKATLLIKIKSNSLLFKRFVGLFMCIICVFKSSAQVFCTGFDEQAVSLQEGANAFNTFGNGNGGFLNDWSVFNGTPSIYSSGQLLGVNAYDGNQYVLAAICDNGSNFSEGVSLRYSFLQGNSYNVSLVIRNHGIGSNPTPIDIDFILLDSALNFTYQTQTGCTQTPTIPANALFVHSVSGFSTDSWQLVNFSISNLNQNYHHLWIRSVFSQGAQQVTTFMLLDSFCIETEVPSVCYSFDEQQISPNESQHTFNLFGNGQTGFLEDWRVVSGTPSIYSTGSLGGISAFEGTQFALQAVCNSGANADESVSLSYPFQQGLAYSISMAVRNNGAGNSPTPLDVDFILMTDSIPYTYNPNTGCSPIPNAPATSQPVFSLSSFDQDTWQVVNFNIPVLTSNFNHLWIRAKFSSGSPLVTTFFLFDSVCVSQFPNLVNAGQDMNQVKFTLNPNPTSNYLNIESEIGQGQYSIQDLTGNQVCSGFLFQNKQLINLGELSNGIYFFVFNTNKERGIKKFFIQN